MNNIFDLNGRTALITGSSRGIGRSLAIGFANAGCDVIIHSYDSSKKANDTVKEIKNKGRKSFYISQDLSTTDCAEKIWQKLLEKISGIDILVLNASQQISQKWEQISVEDFNSQMNINVRSSMLLIQKAVVHMQKTGWGRILTVGSVQERKPHPDMLVYSASKAAQTLMILSLATQLAPYGITINNLAPGVIMTDRNKDAFADEQYREKVTKSIPIGYWGMPEDCVGAALLLCSDAGRYITGQSLFVDGGKSL
ncbi:MAG TPA: SDR family oxidoreductase [Christensenellaceae bacterium]|jgi:glucose 1-dehydrogenase|nr:SDR family oxidoreductase [Christensenellaceae bacterium]